jgi:DNA-binding protein H-NS
MKSPRLASMTLEELSALRKNIDAIITKKLVKERARFAGLLKDLDGFEAAPVRRGRPPKVDSRKGKRAKAKIKYRGPKGEKWSGRGQTPLWMRPLLKKGKTKEAFLVK